MNFIDLLSEHIHLLNKSPLEGHSLSELMPHLMNPTLEPI